MTILYKLADADLKVRAENGDSDAERILQDRVIVRGLISNDPTYTDQHWTWLDTQLCLHFKRSATLPRRVHLILQINESITGEFLELHWSEVYSWQKFLRNLQGPEPSDTEHAPLQRSFSISGNGAPPWLRFDRDNNKRPYVSILLNDTIKCRQIRSCFGKWIRPLQRFLREDLGFAPDTSHEFLSRLNTLHEEGMSYAEIGRHVENEACYRLERYVYHMRGVLDENLVSNEEWTVDQTNHWLEECSDGLYGLNVLGCSRAEVSVWLRRTLCSIVKNGMDKLSKGEVSDWSKLLPLDFVLNQKAITPVVDRDTVIHALKKFKNRGKKGLGVRQIKKT